jgi:hypothetical protein
MAKAGWSLDTQHAPKSIEIGPRMTRGARIEGDVCLTGFQTAGLSSWRKWSGVTLTGGRSSHSVMAVNRVYCENPTSAGWIPSGLCRMTYCSSEPLVKVMHTRLEFDILVGDYLAGLVEVLALPGFGVGTVLDGLVISGVKLAGEKRMEAVILHQANEDNEELCLPPENAREATGQSPSGRRGVGKTPGRMGSVMDKLVLQVQQEFGREDLGISRCPSEASVGITHLEGVAARAR